MNSNHFRVFSTTIALLLATLACSLPSAAPAKPTDVAGAGVVDFSATQTVLAGQIIPSPKPELPSETPQSTVTPTATPTVTLTPEPSVTSTAEVPQAEFLKETNCRTGPGSTYTLVATFQSGAKVEVVANDLGGGYIFVKNLAKPDQMCYVLATNVKVSGDISALPAYTPPPTPTAAPSFTVEFKNYDACKGDVFLRFIVTNTGSFPFRSAYIKVTDLKTNKFSEQSVSAFDLTTGCIVARNIAPLSPGGTGYLDSARFLVDPHGDKLRAVIMVCTEKNLKGSCVTTTVNITK